MLGVIALHTTLPSLSSLPGLNVGDARRLDRWLLLKAKRTPSTLEGYHRAARRLLVWCHEQGLRLDNLTEADASRYLSHLSHPPAHWIFKRGVGTERKPTQLFYGALSPTSRAQERILLVTLFSDLGEMGEAHRNPFKLTVTEAAESDSVADKALSQGALEALLAWLEAQPGDADIERWRWVCALLYHTGLRRIEARFATMADFHYSDEGWLLRVVGKRRKVRMVTLSPKLLTALQRYRQARGMAALPSPDEVDVPAVCPIKGAVRFMSARAFNLMIETLLARCMPALDNPHIQRELAAVTPHRFRHTNATHRLAKGALLETTQDELGHADPRTTRLYAKTARAQRIKDAELL